MNFPAAAGAAIEWADGGRAHSLAALDIEAELAFQQQMEEAAWARLPRPGHPARQEAVDALLAKVVGNEFAFGGPLCLRYLNTQAGIAAYLHFLLARGHRLTGGKAAMPAPKEQLEKRLRDEALAGEDAPRPLTELWLRAVARDFPLAQRGPSPSSATTATPAPSTPGSSPPSADPAPAAGAPSAT